VVPGIVADSPSIRLSRAGRRPARFRSSMVAVSRPKSASSIVGRQTGFERRSAWVSFQVSKKSLRRPGATNGTGGVARSADNRISST